MLNFYPFPHAVLSSKDAWFFYYTLFLLGNLIYSMDICGLCYHI